MARSPAPPRPADLARSANHPWADGLGRRGFAYPRSHRSRGAPSRFARERAADYSKHPGDSGDPDDAGDRGDVGDPTLAEGAEGSPADQALGRLRASIAALTEHSRDLIAQVPADDQVAALSVESLDGCFDELKRFEGAQAALKARLVACASAAKAHKRAGMSDTGAYLRDRLGVSAREAKRQAELSKTLTSMDGAADAVADGRLGIEQASLLGRAARNGRLGGSDEVERDLLAEATTSSPEDLQRSVRKREQQADNDALRRDENRAHALRRAWITKKSNGMWSLGADLDPVNGELVATAIRAFTTPDAAGTPPGERRSTDKRTADGLVELATAAMQQGAPMSGGVRPHVSVVVMAQQPGDGHGGAGCGGSTAADACCGCRAAADASDASGRGGVPDGASNANGRGCVRDGACYASGRSCREDGGCARPDAGDSSDGEPGMPGQPSPPHGAGLSGSGTLLSPEATSRLVCDSALTRIVMASPSQVLDVGRAKRTWSPPQRRAVVARDGSCRGPGCDRPASWGDIHHIHWWQHGGPTDIRKGILLCRYHHRLVHEGGWQLRLERNTGRAVFTDPRGKEHATLPRGAPTLLA